MFLKKLVHIAYYWMDKHALISHMLYLVTFTFSTMISQNKTADS